MSTRKRRCSYGELVVAVPPRSQRSWGSGPRCSTAGPGLSARQTIHHPDRSGCEAWKSEAEIRRLRAENAKLLEQREVLKKSLGILSEVPPRGMPGSNR
jgi:hypothetical protein